MLTLINKILETLFSFAVNTNNILKAKRNAPFLNCSFFLDSDGILQLIVSYSFLSPCRQYDTLNVKLRQQELRVDVLR